MSFSLTLTISDFSLLPWLEPNTNVKQEWNTAFFIEHFYSLTQASFPPDLFSNIQFNGFPKDGIWLLSFLDQLRKVDLQLKEETLHPTNRADSWGYSMLNSIQKKIPENKTELNEFVYWFQLGRFENDGIWKVDKRQIAAVLNEEADEKFLFLCPSFNRKMIDDAVDRLPEFIDVYRSPSWEIAYEKKVEGSKVVKKAVGVIHKLTLDTLIEPREKQVKKAIDSAVENEVQQSESKKKFIPTIKFSDIGGIESILQTIREVIELPLKNPKLFDYLKIKPHKGILLHGPPGCGKTMIAKAIANEINAHFISVKGPELLNKYYGQSEENLRKLFEEASELQPSIIFFDEIDAVAQNRSMDESNRIDSKFVNQLLTLMDGIEDYGSVCVIAATNRPELLDSALLRPGRFDYQLLIPKPDAKGCQQIFDINTRYMPISDQFIKSEFSEQLNGLTGAEIAFVSREGAYNCLRRNYSGSMNNFETMSTLSEFEHLKIEPSDFTKALGTIKKSN